MHHLTVPVYYLQHNLYSRSGWLWTRAMLVRASRPGFDVTRFRREVRGQVDSGHRPESFTRGPKPEFFERIAWARTFADVRFTDAATYEADIRALADAVIADTESVLRALGSGA